MTIRILIADDHEVVRHGLRNYLTVDPEMEVVGEAGDRTEAVRLPRGDREVAVGSRLPGR